MCGIVGFVGREEAAPILLEGLSRLEYRGYDSAGIAVYDQEYGLQVYKTKGRLKALYDLVNGGADVHGQMGLGHTRWATHGQPSEDVYKRQGGGHLCDLRRCGQHRLRPGAAEGI